MSGIPFEARFRRTLSRTLRPLEAIGRRTLLRGVDRCARQVPAHPDPKRVLLVRLDNIGDFVLWLDVARATVRFYQDQGCTVTLLASSAWSTWAAGLNVCDQVIALDQGRFRHDLRYRYQLARSIRRAGFGTVVQPTLHRLPEMGDAVVKISGARERIAALDQRWADTREPSSSEKSLYTRLILVAPQEQGELNANAAFVRALTGRPYRARLTNLRPFVDRDCLGSLPTPLPNSPFVVLFPGASAPGRKWPAEKFAEVAHRCRAEYGWSVIICGGAGDQADAEKIVRSAGAGVLNLAGATDLQQLTAILACAEMLVSNETSAVHIAAALGVSAVCVIGGGHYGRFLPYVVEEADDRDQPALATYAMDCFGCNWVCKFHPARGKAMPCVEQVSFETVWHQIARQHIAREQHLHVLA